MRFIHISDSHLGAATFSRRIAPSGYNQREEDICNSFISAIDRIIELKPQFVLHSGDLFHSVRPTNRILHLGLEQLLRLTRKDIPVVIGGTIPEEDVPVLKEMGIIEVFRPGTPMEDIVSFFQNRFTKRTINL